MGIQGFSSKLITDHWSLATALPWPSPHYSPEIKGRPPATLDFSGRHDEIWHRPAHRVNVIEIYNEIKS
jgi:hypothetical protein